MKVAEKRMNYYNLSSNIIACDNFLPSKQIEDLYIDFLNYRKNFDIPSWNDTKKQTKEFLSEKCGGLDFWINWNELSKTPSFIECLDKWFLHQGLFFYTIIWLFFHPLFHMLFLLCILKTKKMFLF